MESRRTRPVKLGLRVLLIWGAAWGFDLGFAPGLAFGGTQESLVSQSADGASPQNGVAPRSEAVFVFYNVRNYRTLEPVATQSEPRGDKQTDTAKTPILPPKPEAERDRVAAILADLKPDIIGLAEMADATSLADLQERLRALGIELSYRVLVEGPDAERRLALLSRWPLVQENSKPHLPFELAGVPQMVQRGLLDVTVEIPQQHQEESQKQGKRLRFMGVHLKSPRETSAFDQAALRAREAREIRREIEAVFLSTPEVPLLLWGDFNMPRNEPAWAVLAGVPGSVSRLHALPLKDGQGTAWTHHWAEADIYARIDFILASRTANRLVDKDRSGISHPRDWAQASDHRPLFLTLQW